MNKWKMGLTSLMFIGLTACSTLDTGDVQEDQKITGAEGQVGTVNADPSLDQNKGANGEVAPLVNTGADQNVGANGEKVAETNPENTQDKNEFGEGGVNQGADLNLISDADGNGIEDAVPAVIDTDNDGIVNTQDDDIDGDGILNVNDTDIDGDGILNINDTDIDGDGIANINDADIDGDGIANIDDADIDGDGINNIDDADIDGDGINNIDDGDIDGDGVANEGDNDIDGDGILNTDDEDMDGDGITNNLDTDIDGDGITNNQDADIDGDGINNNLDDDIDGDGDTNELDVDLDNDGIPNSEDPDMDGDGIIDYVDLDGDGIAETINDEDLDGDGIPNESDMYPQGESGPVNPNPVQTIAVPATQPAESMTETFSAGTNTLMLPKEVSLAQARSDARAKDFQLVTVEVTDVQIRLVPDEQAALFVANYGANFFTLNAIFPSSGQKIVETQVNALTVSQLIAGVSIENGQLFPVKTGWDHMNYLIKGTQDPSMNVTVVLTLDQNLGETYNLNFEFVYSIVGNKVL